MHRNLRENSINRIKRWWKSLTDAWKAMISLATALGIFYSAYTIIFSGPKVEIVPFMSPTWGYLDDNGKRYAQYLVEASIVNTGDKPYFPSSITMVDYGYAKGTFQPMSLPDTFNYPEADSGIKLSIDQKKDLTRATKIEADGIISGFIWFRLELTQDNAMIDISHYDAIKFTLKDVTGKTSKSQLFHYLPYQDGKRFSPRSGVEAK